MPPKLPVLYLSLHKGNPTLFAEQLRKACHDVGFFLLKHNHGDICEAALETCREFFSREEEEKMSIAYERSPAFRGYMPIGVENTSGKLDFRQQIEYAAEYHESRGWNKRRREPLMFESIRRKELKLYSTYQCINKSFIREMESILSVTLSSKNVEGRRRRRSFRWRVKSWHVH